MFLSLQQRQNAPREKTFVVVAVFHSIVNLFPTNYDLVDCNISPQACYCESFSANTNFPL